MGVLTQPLFQVTSAGVVKVVVLHTAQTQQQQMTGRPSARPLNAPHARQHTHVCKALETRIVGTQALSAEQPGFGAHVALLGSSQWQGVD